MTNIERARQWLADTGRSQSKESVELLVALLDDVATQATAELRRQLAAKTAEHKDVVRRYRHARSIWMERERDLKSLCNRMDDFAMAVIRSKQ